METTNAPACFVHTGQALQTRNLHSPDTRALVPFSPGPPMML